MAEEDEGQEGEENKPKQLTPAEEKASKNGWRPEEDWKGDPDDWVPAKEFNFRGELMGRIAEQSSILNNFKNQIAERDSVIKDMSDLQGKISEREYKKALKTLQEQKAEAIDTGEGEAVVQLDDEIDDLKARRPAPDQQGDKPRKDDTPSEVVEWLQQSQNKWYVQDPFLKSVADGIAKTIINDNPNISPSLMLSQMDEKMRKELPHRFVDNPSPVNDLSPDDVTKGGKPPGERKRTFRDLNEIQQEICRRFEKLGVMTRKEYIDELVAQGDI